MKTLHFDVMLHDRFVCILHYQCHPIFPVNDEELINFVLQKRPTLRGKPFRILF